MSGIFWSCTLNSVEIFKFTEVDGKTSLCFIDNLQMKSRKVRRQQRVIRSCKSSKGRQYNNQKKDDKRSTKHHTQLNLTFIAHCVKATTISYLGGAFDFHCARKHFSEPSSVKIFFSHEKESKNVFPIMWNRNTFFHKNNTLTTQIQQCNIFFSSQ